MSAAERVAFEAFAALSGAEGVFAARLERHFTAFHGPLTRLYGDRLGEHLPAIARLLARIDGERDPQLRRHDFEREITPDWFQRPRQVGYISYVDRFGGTLAGVRERLHYLRELGVSYLHLMPLLRSRDGPNDGGYAVADYRAGRARARHRRRPARARRRPARRRHEPVRRPRAQPHGARARVGAPRDRRGGGLPRLLPDVRGPHAARRVRAHAAARSSRTSSRATSRGRRSSAAGSGPRSTATSGISTTRTRPCSWRCSRPCSSWPTRGVDVLRLDAVPFMWKRLGTDCQNQPEAHELLPAFRAITRIAAPAVVFKAEAIVSPARPGGLPRRPPRSASWPTTTR